MAPKPSFALIYDRGVEQHLDAIESKHHALIACTIREQMEFEPDRATRNRKPLKRPASFGADWELRFGRDNRFRVFYRIDADELEVHVLAIGVKDRERLFIGGEEVRL